MISADNLNAWIANLTVENVQICEAIASHVCSIESVSAQRKAPFVGYYNELIRQRDWLTARLAILLEIKAAIDNQNVQEAK